MPSPLELGKRWNAQKQAGETTISLRQTIFQAVFTELINRAGKLNLTAKEDALVQGLKATAEPEDSSDVRRCMSDSSSDPSVGREPQFGAEILQLYDP